MSTRGRGRGRGRGRTGTVTPVPTGTDPVDFMAALGNMAAAMQATADALGNQINQGNHGNNNDEDGPMTLATFLKVRPPTFRGTSNPTDADNWIQAMERALQAQQVPEEQWVEFGTYQLQGEAQYWWQGTRRILQPDGAAIPWEVFRTEFYKKYFPNSARNAKELELMQLKQGQMTIAEYTSKFEELCHFSRICQGAPEDFAEWKCIKYEGGLRSDILSFVAPIEIRVFSELPGHIASNCPEKKKYETGRVQQPGRVYTTSTIGAEGSKTLIRAVEQGKQWRMSEGHDGLWRFKNRIIVPDVGDLRQSILKEAHKNGF
ncbi:uncharacterized protein [Arachis hypogaea]|uniref:uncharacterized protein n=1 Tax=Arachis hypogaea TaxID=3818 RepID=UPI003B21D5D2